MKIISWNLNGLLSCVKNKSFLQLLDYNPEIICCQEIRTKEEPLIIENYNHIWNHAEREKYSGTAILTNSELSDPLEITRGFGNNEDIEGRLITLEYEDFYRDNVQPINAIWIGSGITEQFTIKSSTYNKETRAQIPNDFGYNVTRGVSTQIKLLDFYTKN